MKLQSRAKERIEGKLTLEWCVSLVERCSPRLDAFPCPPWPWGFFLWRSRERRREVMEVCVSGFAEHQGGYLISCESALGVMTGWRTLMRIPNGRVFSPNAKGFSLNSVHGSRMRIFYGLYAKGTRVCAYSARIKVPECVQNSKIRMINRRKSSQHKYRR
jgi:hypothetical protein